MALNFPDSPTLGQVYTDTTSGFSYEWDGAVWKSYSSASTSNIKSIDDISSGFNGSTTTFALTSNGVTVTPFSDQQLIVNLGGIIQDPINDYSVVGSDIVFTTAPEAGLSFSATLLGTGVSIDYANDGNVQNKQNYTATAGQTSFTFSAGYTPGYLNVYRNGVKLRSTDFTETSSTVFTLNVPAQQDDEIEAIGYVVASIVTTQGQFQNLNVSGIVTATSAVIGDAVIGAAVTINNSGVNVTGVVTATSFIGDGSGLTGTGSTVFNDITTNQEFFPLFTSTTSGTITASGISTSKLTYNPFNGEMTAINFNSTSDQNLKTNIQTVENALDLVDNLRGVSFEWKENGNKSYGIIAQELEKVLPELVRGDDPKTVSYNGIIGVLIEAIKEIKNELDNLKSINKSN